MCAAWKGSGIRIALYKSVSCLHAPRIGWCKRRGRYEESDHTEANLAHETGRDEKGPEGEERALFERQAQEESPKMIIRLLL